MDWTPEAKAAIKKAPPFVRTMARKAVEVYAKNKGMATVTLEIVREVRGKMMGRSIKKQDPSPDQLSDIASGLNVGSNRRQTMHLTDKRCFLANETGDPLHEAFDCKLAVHAMPVPVLILLRKTWQLEKSFIAIIILFAILGLFAGKWMRK